MSSSPPPSFADRCFEVRPDTPSDGITFYSMQPLLNSPATQFDVVQRFVKILSNSLQFKGMPTHIMALETRGYFVGTWLATRLNLPLIPVRKLSQARRLVRSDADLVVSEPYGTEYSASDADRLCIERTFLLRNARILIVDDVLATGGSMRAALSVAKQCGATVQACVTLLYVAQCKTPSLGVPAIALFMTPEKYGEPLYDYSSVGILPLGDYDGYDETKFLQKLEERECAA